MLEKAGEGTFGSVFKAIDQRTDSIVAFKKIKIRKADEGLPREFLREIESLKQIKHENVITIKEVYVGKTSINIVYPYMKYDLSKIINDIERPFTANEILDKQELMIMTNHWDWYTHQILERSKFDNKFINTRWYKAPEILFGNKYYDCKVDTWSAGCILAELIDGAPLFPGLSDIDQISKIGSIVGSPNPYLKVTLVLLIYQAQKTDKENHRLKFPDWERQDFQKIFKNRVLDQSMIDLCEKFLVYETQLRLTADEALNHDFFNEVQNEQQTIQELIKEIYDQN
ncbi:cyclin-dependent kinase 1-like isoform 2 [Stylonychia lemnae]|uniref:Cyclin-dependent kinase 2 homolog n=1 Tax=Stylonychia lemnae TaxID=5949 RepID=A0A077ZRD0_STYLE|nr:cyclin-dependent kinase 1-like isoform 2 [Stylonychia lemnae]|eukprot:CDW72478.1 cyclin-dependent kinase 1-like isoform 2 [Stylonychia lemnae]